ncbi:MAG TPA: antibiotic biosynthesis monooxygenase family protein [Kiloniellaceae bacterium]
MPRFRIREGHFEAFLRRVCQQRDDCLEKEAGCHHFDVLVARDRPDEVLLYEIYQDAEAITTHRTYPHYLSFKADTQDMVESVDLQTWALMED